VQGEVRVRVTSSDSVFKIREVEEEEGLFFHQCLLEELEADLHSDSDWRMSLEQTTCEGIRL
jgi:hypothetical protein